jgi:1,4-dihydroxy-2-naphthoate polyprenyltransferase
VVLVLISSWLRVIRIRFLLASVIGVSTGLAISYWKTGQVDPLNALLTYVGVIFLHASVDLLNDYWDFKRGIDSVTTRTKFSGGTGVLPEKLLRPRQVYVAGMIFLILGAAIGAYFVFTKGITIAIILGFAVIAIYFYSTSIVNAGLGELFVAIKGAMIVLGTFYVQTSSLDPTASMAGAIIGLLSATVLFVNSFPDYAADKASGRRTLVILLGTETARQLFPLFFVTIYVLIITAILLGFFELYALATFSSLPLALRAVKALANKNEPLRSVEGAMADTVMFGRATGFLLAVSLVVSGVLAMR